jgi:preprotein translocase subunit SecD
MKGPRFTCLTVAAGLALVLGGCATQEPADGPAMQSLELRAVVSEVEEACTAPPVTSDVAAPACDQDGATTYQLAKSLGSITPTSAHLADGQGAGGSIVLQFDRTDRSVLASATRETIGERLAILLDGRVLSAPQVMEPLDSGQVTLAFGSSTEAREVDDRLHTTKSEDSH